MFVYLLNVNQNKQESHIDNGHFTQNWHYIAYNTAQAVLFPIRYLDTAISSALAEPAPNNVQTTAAASREASPSQAASQSLTRPGHAGKPFSLALKTKST